MCVQVTYLAFYQLWIQQGFPHKQNEQLLEGARAKGGPAILGLLEKIQNARNVLEITSGHGWW